MTAENGLRYLDTYAEDAEPFRYVFADTLPDTFTPPDEIVQGMLTAGDASVIYGDSNSGKTFLVIDLAASVASGTEWMGRQTEPGLVVYLAAESPASVQSRMQAYQRHHDVRVPNFAIVQNPIDLFHAEEDTDEVISLVRKLEKQLAQKARLIIIDTLARVSAGANENAGQDMGLVVRRIDRIRNECKAHVLIIHHSGKNAAAGSRGWSGVRAAVDTEIEITDGPSGRCAEVMKQRDLSTKGLRIGFRLIPVTLGQTKWGDPATSCVVVADGIAEASMQAKRPTLRSNQQIANKAIGEALRKSPHHGKGGAPATRPCIQYDEAVAIVAERIPADSKHKTTRAKSAITGLVERGYLDMKGEWLWDK